MKINNHDVNTDKYSKLLILKKNKYVTDIVFYRAACLSNAWIVTKRKKVIFRFLYHTKDH